VWLDTACQGARLASPTGGSFATDTSGSGVPLTFQAASALLGSRPPVLQPFKRDLTAGQTTGAHLPQRPPAPQLQTQRR